MAERFFALLKQGVEMEQGREREEDVNHFHCLILQLSADEVGLLVSPKDW